MSEQARAVYRHLPRRVEAHYADGTVLRTRETSCSECPWSRGRGDKRDDRGIRRYPFHNPKTPMYCHMDDYESRDKLCRGFHARALRIGALPTETPDA